MTKKISLLSGSLLLLFFVTALSSWIEVAKSPREYYQLTIYHYNSGEQEKIVDNYLQNGLLPALHRMKIANVGVFKPIANDTASAKLLYVFVKLKSLDEVEKIPAMLGADAAYQSAGAAYINADYTNPPYTRKEIILLKAFPLAPQMQLPVLQSEKKERVYELRSYQSATEKIFRNKVKMFNEGGEIGLFKRLNFNAIFYSEVIAGSKMPNLMYMTSFENMDDRDQHWKSFGSDPQWKKLSAMPEYQHNVSQNDIIFLRPVAYSDF